MQKFYWANQKFLLKKKTCEFEIGTTRRLVLRLLQKVGEIEEEEGDPRVATRARVVWVCRRRKGEQRRKKEIQGWQRGYDCLGPH